MVRFGMTSNRLHQPLFSVLKGELLSAEASLMTHVLSHLSRFFLDVGIFTPFYG